MTHETYYEYDSNINLDDQNLYEYIKYDKPNNSSYSKISRIANNIKNEKVPDKKKEIKINSKESTSNGNFIIYVLLGCLLLLFFYFLITGKLKCNEINNLNQDILNPISDDFGMGSMRAVFYK